MRIASHSSQPRCGMLRDVEVTQATGTSEREAGLRILRRSRRRCRKQRYIGTRPNQLWAESAGTAFNLVRIGSLIAEPA